MTKWTNEYFSKKAKEEGYYARSIYKLQEIDKKWNIIKGGRLIIDLGAAPGSWTQYSLKREPSCKVIAVDINDIKVSSPRLISINNDVRSINFRELLNGNLADVILSDMAPSTSGNSTLDSVRSYELALLALNVVQTSLKKDGHSIIKLFMGKEFENFRGQMKKLFKTVQLFRPKSTRKESREIYFIGLSSLLDNGVMGGSTLDT